MQRLDQVRRVRDARQLCNRVKPVRPFDKNDRRHCADVEVLPDMQNVIRPDLLQRPVLFPAILPIHRAAGEVDELAQQVGFDQFARVAVQKRLNVIRRQKFLVFIGAGLHHRIIPARIALEVFVNELEALGRRRHPDPVDNPRHHKAKAGDDLSPSCRCLVSRQNVDFVHQRAGKLEAHDARRVIHRPTDDRAVIFAATVELDFLVSRLDLAAKPQFGGGFVYGRPEGVADVAVCRGEVSLHQTRMLTSEQRQVQAADKGLARSETADKCAELGIKPPQKDCLWFAQAE